MSQPKSLIGAALKSKKSRKQIKEEIDRLKLEYGISEKRYFEKEYYLLDWDELQKKAESVRKKRYRISRISERTGMDKEDVAKAMKSAKERYGISGREFFEGEYYNYTDLRERQEERKKKKKKNKVREKDLAAIAEETGWSEEEILSAITKAEEDLGIDPRTYIRGKYYLKSKVAQARAFNSKKRRPIAQKRIMESISEESGKKEEEILADIKELNEEDPELRLSLQEYFDNNFYMQPKEKYSEIAQTLLQKKELAADEDTVTEEQAADYRELVRKTLSRGRKEKIFKMLEPVMPELSFEDERTEDILVDMQMTQELMGFSNTEYIMFDFFDKSIQERNEFVSNRFKTKALRPLNHKESREIADDKYRAYCLLKDYYGREACYIDSEGGYEAFREYCRTHHSFVKKSNFDAFGRGVQKVDIDENTVLKDLYDDLTAGGQSLLLEGLIEAGEEIRKLNPSSVNTVRVCTLADYKGDVQIVDTFMKIGRDGSFIDNGGAGGILVHVNKDTGVFDSDGVDEKGYRYVTHPDHGYTFKGYQLPDWDEARKLAIEIGDIIDGLRYVGWDLTYTKDGKWIVVECNAFTQFIGQQATAQKGVKRQLLEQIQPTLDYLEAKETEDNERC